MTLTFIAEAHESPPLAKRMKRMPVADHDEPGMVVELFAPFVAMLSHPFLNVLQAKRSLGHGYGACLCMYLLSAIFAPLL